MRIHVADHPLIAHKLTTLRDERHRLADVPAAGRRAGHAARLRGHPRRTGRARTRCVTPGGPGDGGPAGHAQAAGRADPAGRARACSTGMMRLLPTAEVGFLGMVRDEETLQASTYADAAARGPVRPAVLRARPDAGHRRHAGGGDPLPVDRGADDITAICLLARPRGCARLERTSGLDVPVTVVTAGWTRSSTRRATSSPASATPATACTASRLTAGTAGSEVGHARRDQHHDRTPRSRGSGSQRLHCGLVDSGAS